MGLIRMARPTTRDRSKYGQHRSRIPLDVRDRVRGSTLLLPIGDDRSRVRVSPVAIEITCSLRTSDKAEIITRNAAVLGYLANVYSALRSDRPEALSHRDCVALAGEWYRAWASPEMARRVADPEFPDLGESAWRSASEHWAQDFETGDAQVQLAPLVDRFILGKGRHIDAASREVLLRECARALLDAKQSQLRNAQGDYSPDPKAARFPAAVAPSSVAGAGLTLVTLFQQWRHNPEQLKRLSQATVRAYDRAFREFGAFLAGARACAEGEIDCRTITKLEVRRYAEHRLEKVSAKTVNEGDLAALKSVFGWATESERLAFNPAEGVRLKGGRRRTVAPSGFTDAEAGALLKHAFHYRRASKQESRKTEAAKRWLPWLMAYTGARVGEVGQLRKQDVHRHLGHWAMTITHDAGTVKTKSTRQVPLHQHLIDQDFLEFVEKSPDGHLFITPNAANYDPKARETRTKDPRGILGPLRALANRLAEFAREIVTREDVAPNHGWRHRFKAKGRNPNLGIHPAVLDAIQDHAPRTEGEEYGGGDLFEAMVAVMAKLPRYEID